MSSLAAATSRQALGSVVESLVGLPRRKVAIALTSDGRWTQTVTLLLSLGYLASVTLDAPIRFALSLVKLAPLLYLRDLVGPALFAVLLVRGIFWKRWHALPLWTAGILALHSFLGILSIGSIAQVLFGLKVWLPLLAGTLAGSFLRSPRDRTIFLRGCLLIWALSVVGVALQVAGAPFPWEGFTSEVGGVEIEGQRSWSTGGLQRVAGFGRVSTDTAANLISQGAFVAFLFSPIPRLALALLTLFCVAATTMKAMIMASLLMTGLVIFQTVRFPGRKWVLLVSITSILVGVILLPVLTVTGILEVNISNPIQYLLFASLLDRVVNTWPDALALLLESPMPWLGRGVGGIGSAQVYFEKSVMNPADNLFVFMAVTFGVFVIPYLVLLVRSILPKTGEAQSFWKGRSTLIVCLAFVGLTTGTVECPGALFLVGIALSPMGVDLSSNAARKKSGFE